MLIETWSEGIVGTIEIDDEQAARSERDGKSTVWWPLVPPGPATAERMPPYEKVIAADTDRLESELAGAYRSCRMRSRF
ncbi:MAG: hypothetical protein KatS3mg110_3189 [Pirellulaceae bacterium]|nr:MAG: hypothetical protein KatS3mg110_3189 [Pirellulaceae bacterium]